MPHRSLRGYVSRPPKSLAGGYVEATEIFQRDQLVESALEFEFVGPVHRRRHRYAAVDSLHW
jgi:hypothetical protein